MNVTSMVSDVLRPRKATSMEDPVGESMKTIWPQTVEAEKAQKAKQKEVNTAEIFMSFMLIHAEHIDIFPLSNPFQ